MGLEKKSILAFVDDESVAKHLEEKIKPLAKSLIVAKNGAEAQHKAQNQQFDVVLLRSAKSDLANPKGLFAFFQGNKDRRDIPWIVLGKDVESEEILIKHNHVKFVPTATDTQLVLTILNSIFFSPAGANGKLDVNFINPLVKAVTDVLKSMAKVELNRETPFLKQAGSEASSRGDVSGVIAMNSNYFLGSLAICFEEKLILKVYENMFGSPSQGITEDVKDAVSEMTNIIFGNAKRDLNALGHTIAPALPSVVTGKNHEIRHSISGKCICIPFNSAEGKLIVECMISVK